MSVRTKRTKSSNGKHGCACLFISLVVLFNPVTHAIAADGRANPDRLRDKCSTVIVGKGVAAAGEMLLAHNEDLGNYSAHHYRHVPHAKHQAGETVTTHFGAVVPQVAETYAYTGTSLFDIAYSPGDVTSGINENLVVVVNNASYRRDAPEVLPNQGRLMWTEFTKFALERARTAAEAVEIIGSLASTYKLGADSGTIFGVIDPNEGWWVEVTLDGQWVAQRIAENTASERANIFRIGVVDFADKANFKYSDDLVDFARQRGWYHSGDFNFTTVYADPTKVDNPYNTRRTWRINALLKDAVAARAVEPPLLMSVLRDHYEGTEFDLTAGHTLGSPHYTDERTLCRMDTEVSTVIQPRTRIGHREVPPDIGGISWRALGTPCSSIYTPWYLGSPNVPAEFQTGDSHYSRDSAYWVARNLSKSVDIRYQKSVVDPWVNRRDQFEATLFNNQGVVEAQALELYRSDPGKARSYLSGYTSRIANEALGVMRETTALVESH